jgi:hypothetical protein
LNGPDGNPGVILVAAAALSQWRLRTCWLRAAQFMPFDLDQRTLAGVPDQYNGVEIRKTVADITSPHLLLPSVDGILMANTLHFIREQQAFLKRLRSRADRFLIVEYERSNPNP